MKKTLILETLKENLEEYKKDLLKAIFDMETVYSEAKENPENYSEAEYLYNTEGTVVMGALHLEVAKAVNKTIERLESVIEEHSEEHTEEQGDAMEELQRIINTLKALDK